MQGTLNEDTLDDVIYKIGTKAKEMEKEQIIESWENGRGDINYPIDGENYYNETFKSK